jgi:hypothetical protein
MEKDEDENSRDSNIKKTREYGINDIEMVVSNTSTSTTKDVGDDFSFSLSGIPSPPMSPLGDLDKFKKPDSFYMLNDRTFDGNNDGHDRQDVATISSQNNQNNDSGDYMNDTANDNTNDNGNDDTNENGNDNASFSSSDKQYRNFNFKI